MSKLNKAYKYYRRGYNDYFNRRKNPYRGWAAIEWQRGFDYAQGFAGYFYETEYTITYI